MLLTQAKEVLFVEGYLLAFDQGTTSSRTIIFDTAGQIVAQGNKDLPQIYPQPGWVEHNPEAIYKSQLDSLREAIIAAKINITDIIGVGITNQRETTIVWDKNTGKPIYNAIVWQCRRTAAMCQKLKDRGLEELIRKRTGLLLDSYFSATKLKWILENVHGAKEKAAAGDLLFGTVDTWLIWRLTGGKVYVTDYTNASRTMMYDIHRCCWDDDILRELAIPYSMLPKVVSSCGVVGELDPAILGKSIPIAGLAGDQQAALFGQGCFCSGMAKVTYGTGCFLLMHTGDLPVASEHRLLTTMACSANGKPQYALEGSVFVGGAVIQWLRDELKIIETAAESEVLALSVPDTGGVVLVPSFTGLGAPYWDSYSRGMLIGINRGTNRGHVARAALEAIALQVKDVIDAMQMDIGEALAQVKADGGASANNFLMQFEADMLNIPVERPKITETTALGAAFLAGLACEVWQNVAEIADLWQLDRRFLPHMPAEERSAKHCAWQKAVERTLGWLS